MQNTHQISIRYANKTFDEKNMRIFFLLSDVDRMHILIFIEAGKIKKKPNASDLNQDN